MCDPGFFGKYCEKGRYNSSVKPERTILGTTSRECHPNTFFTFDPVHAPYPGTGMYVTPGELGLNMLSCSLPPPPPQGYKIAHLLAHCPTNE